MRQAKNSLVLLWLLIFGLKFALPVFAQDSSGSDTSFEAVVSKIDEQKQITLANGDGSPQLYQKLEVQVTQGSLSGQTITIENGTVPVSKVQEYKVGDKIVVSDEKDQDGKDQYIITDYVRRDNIVGLFVLFVIITIAIARLRGLKALISMAISFLIIFLYVLPELYKGANPVVTALIGSMIIIPITFYVAHGLNSKTTVAIIGTFISLFIATWLASSSVTLLKLTGYTSDEVNFLQLDQKDIDPQGLLLAGIIIGLLGVLNDITISQAAVVKQLKESSPLSQPGELYQRAMDVGKDHIASMINTLILVYAGASLPLMLIFISNPQPTSVIINYEFLATEICKTLVASIGLILAVPITTFIAVHSKNI